MADVTIRSEVITSYDSFTVRTLGDTPNRLFIQGEAAKRTLTTVIGIGSGADGAKVAKFYTGNGSGTGTVVSRSQQSSSGTVYPITTIEKLG